MPDFVIKSIDEQSKTWAMATLAAEFGSDYMVTRGKIHRYYDLQGFVASIKNNPVGLVTYCIENRQCEVTSLNSLEENLGIGTALLQAVAEIAKKAGCQRIWLITTNANIRALGFYQKRGYHLAAIYREAIMEYRKLKPEIPWIETNGIPLRDEIEVELPL